MATRPATWTPSALRFVVHLVIHLALLAGAVIGVLLVDGPWRLAVVPVVGVLLVFLFAPFHECTHRNAFSSARANRWVASVLGILIARPARAYESFHLAHHRHTNDPQRDPELQSGLITTRRSLVAAMTGLPLHVNVLRSTVHSAFGRVASFVPVRVTRSVVREARWTLAMWGVVAGASVASGSTLLVWVWLGPLILGSPFLQIALLAEHTACNYTGRPVADTRTTECAAPLRWLTWNASHHSAHHASPQAPYFHLPDLTKQLRSDIVEYEPGYRSSYRTILRRLGETT